jgi:hypothetical protein
VNATNGTAIITSAAETSGILGIVTGGAGNTGTAQICALGGASCVFDNATTNGHFVGVSSSVAGDCTDLGTSSSTAISAGTTVIGTVTVTAAAGTRAMFVGTPDVQGQSGGGGNTKPAGAAGDIQYRATGNNFAAEAAFNYNATNNQLLLTGATTASDNTTWMFDVTGTMPTTPSATVTGLNFPITSAGSASFLNGGMTLTYGAGYTGSSATRAATFTNAAVGTGATPSMGSTTAPVGNLGVYSLSNPAGAGDTFGVMGDAGGSTGLAAGVYGRSAAAVAGTNIGVLGSAAGSTEATGRKNIAGYFALDSTDPSTLSGNGDRGLEVQAGTLADANSLVASFVGTLPASPSGTTVGIQLANITSAGSASQVQRAATIALAAGYTGVRENEALLATNTVLGTGACGTQALNVIGFGGTCGSGNDGGNAGISTLSSGVGAGETFGIYAEARGSSTAAVAIEGKSAAAVAGTNLGGVFAASNSTEGTNLKNVALYATLGSTDPAAIATNGSFAAYIDGGTLPDELGSALYVQATMPTTIAAAAYAEKLSVTSAGSSSQVNGGLNVAYGAGYTGASGTRGVSVTNSALGTATTPSMGATTTPAGNLGVYGQANGAGAGYLYGVAGDANGSTGMAVGVYGKSAGGSAGTNIGVLASAAASTEGTNLKNVALYAALSSTNPATVATNGSFGAFIDGGTLPDGPSSAVKVISTLASSPATSTIGERHFITGNGSASQNQFAYSILLSAGYTGSSNAYGNSVENDSQSSATGMTLATGGSAPTGNFGQYVLTDQGSTGGGNSIGLYVESRKSTLNNYSIVSQAIDNSAGTNLGVLGVAANSTEGTNYKNVGGWFSVSTEHPGAIASNVSLALGAVSDGTADIFRGYSTTTLATSITKDGNIATTGTFTSSATGALGWTVQSATNQACNTTCVSACVVGTDAVTGGFLACTDATADSCLCAGSS